MLAFGDVDKEWFDCRDTAKYNDYGCDDLDRVTDVTYHNGQTETFNMDTLGNRTSVGKRDGGTDTYALDSATNRYDAATSGYDVICEYDEAGNTITDKDGYTYDYDYENRIVKIEDSSSNDVAEFAYDALGRRIRVIDSKSSTTMLYYYNPQWQVLAEYNGAGAQQRYFVYGNYIDEPLVMHRQSDDKDYYYAHDHLYCVVALIAYDDQAQPPAWDVVERYEYDAYGTVHITDASYNTRTTSNYGNPYTFTGRRLDQLDSDNLEVMYYRHRTYDTYAARFLQQDPLAAFDDGYIDGMSLYQYVESRPTVYTDSYGLSVDLSILDCYDGCDRFATVERAGCRLRCRRGWDADFPALDAETLKRKLDSLTKKYVPRKPNVKLTIAEIPLGPKQASFFRV